MLGQDPGDVQGDVADAEHRHLAGLKRPGAGVVGVSVVPGDEVGRAVAAGKADTGDVEGGVRVRAGGHDDRVVVFAQLGHRHVPADVDVAEEPDVAALEHVEQRLDDRFDPRMVGGDAVADQPVGGGKSLEEVDRDVEVGLGEDVRRVDSSWPGADNRDVVMAVCHVCPFYRTDMPTVILSRAHNRQIQAWHSPRGGPKGWGARLQERGIRPGAGGAGTARRPASGRHRARGGGGVRVSPPPPRRRAVSVWSRRV